MTNKYNGYYLCESCYFECKDYKGRPCEYYTPCTEDAENTYVDMVIESERQEFIKEWNAYLEDFYN